MSIASIQEPGTVLLISVTITTVSNIYGVLRIYQAFYKLLIKILIAVKSAAANIGIHASLSVTLFLGYMPSSGIIGSYGSSIPSF